MKRLFSGLLLLGSLAATSCGTGPDEEEPSIPKATNEAPAPSRDEGEAAPATFLVKLETTKGDVIIEFHRDWSPLGVDRIHRLVKTGFYDDCAFFRVLPRFAAQFGIHGDPQVSAEWRNRNLIDELPKQSNLRGMVSYAQATQPNTRTTQLFINLKDNSNMLDPQNFAPIGKVIQGMDVVDSLFSRYGEQASNAQAEIQMHGNAFLKANFPQLDYIKKATIVTATPEPTPEPGKTLENTTPATQQPLEAPRP